MNRARRRKLALAGVVLTFAWLAVGAVWFALWQADGSGAEPTQPMWREAIGAALLVALISWVLAGIAYGIIVWIVTGRGPRA